MITVFGSLNVDYIFQVPQLPAPGETVLASNMQVLPGGKGANQAVAAARAGAKVSMVGAVGRDALSKIALAGLLDAGVDTSAVALSTMPTGTAAINVDAQGENAITVSSGANLDARGDSLDEKNLTPRTTVLLQMEIPMNAMADLIQRARAKEARIIWNLAPMQNVDLALLKQVDCLIVNEVELNQLHSELHQTLDQTTVHKDVEQKAWDIFTLTRQSGCHLGCQRDPSRTQQHPANGAGTHYFNRRYRGGWRCLYRRIYCSLRSGRDISGGASLGQCGRWASLPRNWRAILSAHCGTNF